MAHDVENVAGKKYKEQIYGLNLKNTQVNNRVQVMDLQI
jgi:hypothetical protein